MSAETLQPPQEDLQYIPQLEMTEYIETEREAWERGAIQQIFLNAPESFGAAVDQEKLDHRLHRLYRATHIMTLTAEQRKGMRSDQELPVISTQAGVDELLNQVVALVDGNGEILKSPLLTSIAHSISYKLERMAQSGVELDDEMTIRECSALLSMAEAQEAALPNMKPIEHRKSVYGVLENQFLAQLVLEDPEDPGGILTPEIHAVWKDPDFLAQMSEIGLAAVKRFDNREEFPWEARGYSDMEEALMDKIFASLGFDQYQAKKIRDGWGSVRTKDEYGTFDKTKTSQRPEYARNQFKAMFELARKDPEAPKRLFEQFGIRHFARYKTAELLEQLDYQAGPGDDVEVLITASDDWNTAYRDRYTRTKDDLNFKHPIYHEASSMIEITRMLTRASRHYGPIDKLLISGHGSLEHFRMGAGREPLNGVVDIDSVKHSQGAKRLVERTVLSPDCLILISSCSVGKPGGIAEAIAKATGLKTIAPEDIASGLIYDKDEGDYDARYKGSNGQVSPRDARVIVP